MDRVKIRRKKTTLFTVYVQCRSCASDGGWETIAITDRPPFIDRRRRTTAAGPEGLLARPWNIPTVSRPTDTGHALAVNGYTAAVCITTEDVWTPRDAAHAQFGDEESQGGADYQPSPSSATGQRPQLDATDSCRASRRRV